MSIRFLAQNSGWSILNPKQAYAAHKAMREYRELHPTCEITGSKNKVQVHHIEPVWSNPEKVADPNNFISLSASAHIHLIFGHDGNFKSKYVLNVREISDKIKEIKKQSVVVNRISAQSDKSWFKFW
jgi:hypothetical protein